MLPVHDQWAMIDDLSLSDSHDLALPMLIEDEEPLEIGPSDWRRFIHYRYTVARHKAMLTIHNVRDYDFKDEAGIGGTDVNGLAFRDDEITIEFVHPVVIRARVSGLSVSLEISDEIADHVVYSVWFSRIFSLSRGVPGSG